MQSFPLIERMGFQTAGCDQISICNLEKHTAGLCRSKSKWMEQT